MGDALTKNKELEEAMLCVNGREFLVRLDWARRDLLEESNAWKFITELAYQNPIKFISYVDSFSDQMFEWVEIDQLIKANPKMKIPIIKRYREITGKGLKDSKEAIDARFRKLGF